MAPSSFSLVTAGADQLPCLGQQRTRLFGSRCELLEILVVQKGAHLYQGGIEIVQSRRFDPKNLPHWPAGRKTWLGGRIPGPRWHWWWNWRAWRKSVGTRIPNSSISEGTMAIRGEDRHLPEASCPCRFPPEECAPTR